MANNVIELKSIGELLGKNFFIPSYQRGYRWTGQQVKDLLDDINEFRANSKGNGFYCLQPLVVKKSIVDNEKFITDFQNLGKTEKPLLEEAREIINCHTRWEVIDGQQRLTTLCILLNFLGINNPYTVEYETRENSAEYLTNIKKNIKNAEDNDNVDYYHMHLVKTEIVSWFDKKDDTFKKNFKDTILNHVKFIWYESVDEDPIEVFTRLNIGKIKLTNAELIKALLLNRSNFTNDNSLVLRQQEIASRWDQIEYTLQDDAFWLFLHSEKYKPATRIDFIFDLICDQNPWKVYKKQDKNQIIGTDEYQTFRYFYEYFHRENRKNLIERLNDCWKEVVKYFQILQEWYNDPIYYHYIGYLLSLKEDHKEIIKGLLEKWKKNNKEEFKKELEVNIKGTIKYKSLNQPYKCTEKEELPDKTNCKSILLLHNIQTVINQNKGLINSSQYGLPVFYKFPFHLYKKEKWDVEHIDSNTTNKLDNFEDKKQWLEDVLNNEIAKEKLTEDKELQKLIGAFKGDSSEENVNELWEKVYEVIVKKESNKLNDAEKNQIWNFCLLNASTNRSYGNAIFPVKRQTIIEKDQGINKEQKDDNQTDKKQTSKKNVIAFVPPVTKNVFLKYYTKSNVQFRTWSQSDAEEYRENIYETLQKFDITLDKKNKK